MTVFNQSAFVITDAEEVAKDNGLPDPGVLNLASIADDSAFGGIPGKDCMLVRGGYVLRRIFDGGQLERMDKDLKTEVDGDELRAVKREYHRKVGGPASIMYGATLDYEVTDISTHNIKGPVNARFAQLVNEHYDQPHYVEAPGNWYESKGFLGENNLIKQENNAVKNEQCGEACGLIVNETAVTLTETNITVTKNGVFGLELETKQLDTLISGLKAKLHGGTTEVTGLATAAKTGADIVPQPPTLSP